MGRPRKRQRQEQEPQWFRDEDCPPQQNIQGLPGVVDPDAVSSFPNPELPEATEFLIPDNIDPSIYSGYTQSHDIWSPQSRLQSTKQSFAPESIWSNDFNILNTEDTPPSDSLPTPPTFTNIPDPTASKPANRADIQTWDPDYMKFGMSTVVGDPSSNSNSELPSSGQSQQSCACLSNLYLTLSSLSTLQSSNARPGQLSTTAPSVFPIVTPAAINSLRTASREAYRVIHCSFCPRSFQTGIQNLMLLCTLLSVLGDIWGRLSRAPIADIRSGFAAGTHNANSMKDADWRSLIRRLVRKGVYGRCDESSTWHYLEVDDDQSGKWYSLAYLINSVERRQKTWHGQLQDDGEFPGQKHGWVNTEDPTVKFGSILSPNFRTTRGQVHVHHNAGQSGLERKDSTELRHRETQNGIGEGHLCLKIVGQVREIMAALKLDVEAADS